MTWLNRERLTVYPKIIAAAYLVVLGYLYLTGSGLTDGWGDPIGGDFSHYWVASALALQGEPTAVYNPSRFLAALQDVFGVKIPLIWLYPPTYLLLVLPLALLPYLISLGLWLSSTLAGFILVLRRIAPHPVTIWLGLAFPGTFLNLIHGQNGFLSAMLLGAGLLLLEPAPIAAGILFGLLSYKPHFVILVPLALAAGRRWRALLSLGITSACLLLASVLLLGADVFTAFRDNLPATLQVLETGRLGGNVFPLLSKMSTLFAALILAGSPLWLAQILQVALMLATAAIVAWVWFREASPAVRAAVLVLGVLLFPPYEFLYDLAILALPIAWLGWEGVSEGWLPGEQTVLFVCFLTPMLTPMLAKWLNLQITPLVLALLLAVALRRLRLRPHIMEI